MTARSTHATPRTTTGEPHDGRVQRRAPVLVVEDDPSHRRLIVRLLERMGHTVVAAHNGETALHWVMAHPAPALVCLDLGLPKLSGFRVCEQIRAAPHTRVVPILTITARTSVQDHTFALEMGADAYLEKPFHWRELERLVRGLLRSSS